MWYNALRRSLQRFVLKRIDIVDQEYFSDKDQERIKGWLTQSAELMGFHLYIKARDKALVQELVGLDVTTKEGRKRHQEIVGRRLELNRLLNRAKHVRDDNRKKAGVAK